MAADPGQRSRPAALIERQARDESYWLYRCWR
jgi:hypothetical protein